MAMGKTEREALELLVKRLKKERLGCGAPRHGVTVPTGYEPVLRLYVDTWLVGPLEALLEGDAKLARSMLR